MNLMIVGGGTGGHVMPAIVVAKEVKRISSRTKIIFLTDKKNVETVRKIAKSEDIKLTIKKTFSGKFIRYAGWGIKDYFEHFDITVKELIVGNAINFVRFLFGILQNFCRLLPKSSRPDVIFLKGGYVGLPVGIVAGLLKIPYIIHESDSAMGVANRILKKKAELITIGMPCEESERMRYVGIPVGPEYKAVSKNKQRELKKSLGFQEDRDLIVVTGGSQGAQSLNEVTRKEIEKWLKIANVGLITGKKMYAEMEDMRELEKTGKFRMWDFSYTINEILGAADVVISRAGATTIAELAMLKKAVILVPFERLPGSHQVLNARKMSESGAAECILNDEMLKNPDKLTRLIEKVLGDEDKKQGMMKQISLLAKPNAGKKLAESIFEVYYGKK